MFRYCNDVLTGIFRYNDRYLPIREDSVHAIAMPWTVTATSEEWAVLLVCSFLTFGNYFAYDIPASIARPLQVKKSTYKKLIIIHGLH